MEIFNSVSALRLYLESQRRDNKSIGFVPTMGALHAGHGSLITASRAGNDLTVCSIFVNPTQFNNPDDLAHYPRTLAADCAMLQAAGCDAVFAPSAQEMYPEPAVVKFDFGALERVMEGQFRPGHFNGVGVVVSKLFNIVQPDRAYFGQKDLQQTAVVRQMMVDLGFQIELHICPTLREADGLAMSSRNVNILAQHRPAASTIFRILNQAKTSLLAGESSKTAQVHAAEAFASQPDFKLAYFEIVNLHTLQPVAACQPEGQTAICAAAFLGKVRLIDNVVF